MTDPDKKLMKSKGFVYIGGIAYEVIDIDGKVNTDDGFIPSPNQMEEYE